MSEPKFKRGDVVELINGRSPSLVVANHHPDVFGGPCTEFVWFDTQGLIHTHVLPDGLLRPAGLASEPEPHFDDNPVANSKAVEAWRAKKAAEAEAAARAEEDRIRFAATEGV